MEYKYSKHSVYFIRYHLVWSSKRRRSVLIDGVRGRLIEIIKDKANGMGVDIIFLKVMPDYVHILISACPTISIHKIVKGFKSSSSILRKEFPHLLKLPSLWTRSYFVSTAEYVSDEIIKRYIEGKWWMRPPISD